MPWWAWAAVAVQTAVVVGVAPLWFWLGRRVNRDREL